MSNSYDNIYKLIKFTNSKVDYFEGTKKYISTGDSDDIENGQEVTFDNKPSRANVMGSAGDILIAKMANTNKVILLDNDTQNNIYSTGFYCLNSTKLFNKYLFYLLSNDEFNKEKDSWSFGTTQVSLNENGFKRIKINFVSDIIKQMKISKFLDKKVLLLDKILENQQQQIEKLKEYKQSLISEVVTKGLNPNVEFKDSGIEWIDQIPLKWDVIPFKVLFQLNKGVSITKEDLVDEGVPVINYGEIHSKYGFEFNPIDNKLKCIDTVVYEKVNPNTILKKGDFVFCDTSEDLDGSGNFSILNDDQLVVAGYHTIVAKPIMYCDSRYLAYLFTSDYWRMQIRSKVYGIKLYSITQSILKNVSLILPPQDEQLKISSFLDSKIKGINRIIEIKKIKIDELNEYKKSLIYEYVTGKKEVF